MLTHPFSVQRTARASGWMMTAIAAALAADLTWRILVPEVSVAVTPMERPSPSSVMVPDSTANLHHSERLDRLTDLALFGEEAPVLPVSAPVAPDTQLNLRLLGTMAGEHPQSGWAMIAQGSGPERLFTVGGRIGSTAVRVHSIYADRVVLERNGQLETLRFPQANSRTGLATAAPVASPSGVAAPQEFAVSEPVLRREPWFSDPDAMLRAVQMRPVVREGQVYGVMLRPTRNAREFRQAGLENGDIVTSVNGVPIQAMDSPEALLAQWGGLQQIDLTIDRQGQTVPLTIRLLDE